MGCPQGAEFGYADLKVAEHFQEKRLELGVGAVDFIDQQQHWLRRKDRLKQRSRQEKAQGEEDILLRGDAVGSFGQGSGVPKQIVKLVTQELRVEHLLGVLPLIERLRLIQALVTLKADELPPGCRGPGLAEFCLPHAGRAFR